MTVKAVVVAAGDVHAADRLQLADADLVVAADAGGDILDRLGVVPSVLVGDMDSIDPKVAERFAAAGSRVERSPHEKDETDTELAVSAALAGRADEVVVLGALGGLRPDHAMANLLLLADSALRRAAVRIVAGNVTVRAVHGGDCLDLRGGAGSVVSLIPVGGGAEGVVTQGLRYPLNGESLPLGRARGVSNEVVGPGASVTLSHGTLLVFEITEGSAR